MTVVELDCCQHPRHTDPPAPRRRSAAGVVADLGRAVATVVGLAYTVALCGTIMGTAVGIALREWWLR